MVTATLPNLAATLDWLALELGLSTEELVAVLDVTPDRRPRRGRWRLRAVLWA